MLETAIKAALEAGKAIIEIYEKDFEVEFKADESPLTEADRAAHHIIVDALEETGLPVLSEESAEVPYDERKAWERYWLVDPLDGTKEFIKKNGEFTVNIALVEGGIPVLGVVFVPVQDTLYCGDEQGAWKAVGCSAKAVDEIIASAELLKIGPKQSADNFPSGNSGEVAVHQKSAIKNLRVVASKSHCNEETRKFIAELEEQYGEAELVSRGSSLKLCMVAEGSADMYPRIAPTMEWDTAAAHAVVIAAGGKVFSFDASVSASDYGVTNNALCDLRYNKENLLNAYFVVSGLCK